MMDSQHPTVVWYSYIHCITIMYTCVTAAVCVDTVAYVLVSRSVCRFAEYLSIVGVQLVLGIDWNRIFGTSAHVCRCIWMDVVYMGSISAVGTNDCW